MGGLDCYSVFALPLLSLRGVCRFDTALNHRAKFKCYYMGYTISSLERHMYTTSTDTTAVSRTKRIIKPST